MSDVHLVGRLAVECIMWDRLVMLNNVELDESTQRGQIIEMV